MQCKHESFQSWELQTGGWYYALPPCFCGTENLASSKNLLMMQHDLWAWAQSSSKLFVLLNSPLKTPAITMTAIMKQGIHSNRAGECICRVIEFIRFDFQMCVAKLRKQLRRHKITLKQQKRCQKN
jgi:hypothetical protein